MPGKAAGPDGVCPRLLKDTHTSATVQTSQEELEPESLSGKHLVLYQYKIKCLAELNSYRLVALTSYIMKTLKQLFLFLLRLEVLDTLDSLQFVYKEQIKVDDAVLYMLQRAFSHQESGT